VVAVEAVAVGRGVRWPSEKRLSGAMAVKSRGRRACRTMGTACGGCLKQAMANDYRLASAGGANYELKQLVEGSFSS
jgi:hypothetical protein